MQLSILENEEHYLKQRVKHYSQLFEENGSLDFKDFMEYHKCQGALLELQKIKSIFTEGIENTKKVSL